jgi:hypothetical protein
MSDSSDLTHKADELRQQARHEPNKHIRWRLARMAVRYLRLARHLAWSREHPASAAQLAEIFTKRN